jgi:oxygen-independent coproporphyrinogen-3 oxidase
LSLEPGTPLGNADSSLPDGYLFYRFAQWYLERKGLAQYEIASFARQGRECRHNLSYTHTFVISA